MKIIRGDELNTYPVGTVFAHLDMTINEPFGCVNQLPEIIVSTMLDDDSPTQATFITRTEPIFDNYADDTYNNPIVYTMGTSSAGCYDDKDYYVILDKSDIEKMCSRLLNPIIKTETKWDLTITELVID